MNKQTKRELAAALFVAIAGAAIFGWGYGVTKGILFCLVLIAIQAVPVVIVARRRARRA